MRTVPIGPSGLRGCPHGHAQRLRQASADQFNQGAHHRAPAAGAGARRTICQSGLAFGSATDARGGERLPQLSLPGLAVGDFDLALRGLWGDAAPLSPASLGRLKAPWQPE